LLVVPQIPHQQTDRIRRFEIAISLTRSKLIRVRFASVKDCSLRETRLDHNLDFDDKDPTALVGRLYIHTNELVACRSRSPYIRTD